MTKEAQGRAKYQTICPKHPNYKGVSASCNNNCGTCVYIYYQRRLG